MRCSTPTQAAANAFSLAISVMGQFIPTTDEMLERARHDRGYRRKMVSEHLDHLMMAMSRTRNNVQSDPAAASHLQEGARLAVKLTEILHAIGAKRRA